MAREIARKRCMETVLKSPAAVAAHDKAAWLSIFASLAVVEDPVGSKPHLNGAFDARSGRRDNTALARFYDTFIAPNQIVFHVERDIVCSAHVVRDLAIEITMSPEVTVTVPMHLLYELRDEGGEVRIQRLAAHWELLPMLKQLAALGKPALTVGWALGLRMFRHLGMGGIIGFMSGLHSIGSDGKYAVTRFADAVNRQDLPALVDLFCGNNAGIDAPFGRTHYTPAQLVHDAPFKLTVSKLLASGFTVSATLTVDTADGSRTGVGFFEFDAKSRRMHRVRLYWE
jgi:hypothetical protein